MGSDPARAPRTKLLVAGAGWTYLIFVSNRAVTFLSTVVLARLLVPGDFGLMAVAVLVLKYLDAVNDAGMGPALVRETENLDMATKVAFTISAALGGLLAILLVLASPALASYFNDSRLTPVLMFLAPILVFASMNSVQSYWQQRQLKFRSRLIPESLRSLFKAAFSMSFAVAGFGVWSLAIGQLAGQIAAVLGYLKVSELQIRFAYDRAMALRLLSYGIPLSVVTLTGVAAKSIDQVITGKLLSTADLGYYVIGASIPELVVMSLCTTASQVLYPAFSWAREKPRLLRYSYLASIRLLTFLTFPVAAGIALVAHDFVTIAYSERWLPSVPVMQFLAINALVISVSFNAGDILKAVGRPNTLTLFSVASLIISVPLMFAMSGYGTAGIAAAQVAVSLIVAASTLALVLRFLGIPAVRFMKALVPAAIGTLLMVAACQIPLYFMAANSPVMRLAAVVLFGMSAYFVAAIVLNRKMARSFLRKRKARRQTSRQEVLDD